MASYAAVDLGATSGRVAVGTLSGRVISHEIIHRFSNGSQQNFVGSLCWDLPELIQQTKNGLKAASKKYDLESVAVDTWAIDYVLINSEKEITAPTYSYRDHRCDGLMEKAIREYGKEAFYMSTGIQFLPFNTVYQLIAARDAGELYTGIKLIMIPDVINMELTGSTTTEITNASTTQLLNVRSGTWDFELINLLNLPIHIFPKLHKARTILGSVNSIPELHGVKVVAVGSHDTASAVAAAPISSESIFISSGTWSLIGCEITTPITTREAMDANLTNELGVEGTVRLLKNVPGMWMISECLREWNQAGDTLTVEELVDLARMNPTEARINPIDGSFLHPGKMVQRILTQAMITRGIEPKNRGEIAYCIFASLAENYAKVIVQIEEVTGKKFSNVHVVGGGCLNNFLNQLTADATGLEVIAGPAEATLLGNIGVQAIASGEIKDLQELRAMIARSYDLIRFIPTKQLETRKGNNE